MKKIPIILFFALVLACIFVSVYEEGYSNGRTDGLYRWHLTFPT